METNGARREGYSAPARFLHWVTAVAVFVAVPVGVAMTNLGEGTLTNALYEVHKSVGIIAFAIVLARICVRVVMGAPAPEQGLSSWELFASTWVHRALYGLVFLMPILGWIGTSMCCSPVNLFWTIPVTLPVTGSEATTKAIFALHKAGAFLLTGLVALHLAGVLFHVFVKRDHVLNRMLRPR